VPNFYEAGISIIDPAGNLIGFKVLNARHRLHKFLNVLQPGGNPFEFTLYNNSIAGGNTVFNMSAVTVSSPNGRNGFEIPLEDQSGLQLDGALQTTPGIVTRSRSLRWGESVTTSEVVRLNSTAGALLSIGRDVSFEMKDCDYSQLITLLGPDSFIQTSAVVVSQWTIEVDDIQFQDIINAAGHIYLIQSLDNAGTSRIQIGAMEAVPSTNISGVTANVRQSGGAPATDYLCMDLRALSSGTILFNEGEWNPSRVVLDRFLVPYPSTFGSGILKTYAYQNKPDWDYIPL
jgi:hypothetical protein